MLKLNIKKQNSLALTVILVLFCSFIVSAQTRQLAENDKTQIIQAILKREDFKSPEVCCFDSKAENIVYLLAENISAEQLPKLKSIKFVLLTATEIEEKRKTGIEYYSFSEFEVRKSKVQVFFSRTFSDTTAREGNGSTISYECRKVAEKWKIKGRLDSVYAS